jgi:hypothetical protein
MSNRRDFLLIQKILLALCTDSKLLREVHVKQLATQYGTKAINYQLCLMDDAGLYYQGIPEFSESSNKLESKLTLTDKGKQLAHSQQGDPIWLDLKYYFQQIPQAA